MTNNIETFINKILDKYKEKFNEDDIDNVKHYLEYDECEIAIESLILSCIDLDINLNQEEIKTFQYYIDKFNLKENGIYVLDIRSQFNNRYKI